MAQKPRSARGHIKNLSQNKNRKGKVVMEKLNSSKHWTAGSTEDFVHRIASDFLAQLETRIEKGEVSRSELAHRLDRTPGRVSQLFNPGNITIGSAVRLVRAMDMKVALVAYDDDDPENRNGPVNSDIFYRCWKHMGAPITFFELTHSIAPVGQFGYSDAAANIETDFRDVRIDRNAITWAVI
jgi:hypothetical protein